MVKRRGEREMLVLKMEIQMLTIFPGGQFVAVGDSHSRIRMFHINDGQPEKGPELTAHSVR